MTIALEAAPINAVLSKTTSAEVIVKIWFAPFASIVYPLPIIIILSLSSIPSIKASPSISGT